MMRRLAWIRLLFGGIPWIIWISLVFFVPPDTLEALVGFYTFLFLGLFFSFFSFFFFLRSVLWASGITSYLLLRQFHLDTPLHLFLLVGVALTMEAYWRR